MLSQRSSIPILAALALALVAADQPGPASRIHQPQAAPSAAPSFANDVVPILTRLGCNSGSCHGKLAGQNGFKLSLRGYAPEQDYIAITRDTQGRRIARTSPLESLLLDKPLMRVPHQGGHRLMAGSPEYHTLVAWIAAGVPGPTGKEPVVTRIAVEPPAHTYRPGEAAHLRVRAVYSDGAQRDVTALALFKSNEEGLAQVNERGAVKALAPGATAVMASFQGEVAVHVVTTPYDHKVDAAVYAACSNFVDDHVMARQRELRLEPSPACDDATYLRRVSLDLTGTLPQPDEVKAFLSDPDPGKRSKLVDRLLASPAYVDAWTQFWGELFQNRVERDHDDRGRKGVRSFAHWISEQVRTNRPWDEVVRAILTARGPVSQQPAGGYYLVNRGPDSLAEAATHAFLGTRIQCARCHNHPLERFTQDDYYGMAAFFTRVRLDGKKTDEGIAIDPGVPRWRNASPRPSADVAQVGINQPRTGQFLPPRPLDRSSVTLEEGQDPREALADWMTSPQNRTFARAIVNRLWKHFCAVGLVEPVDDLRATNPSTNEPLLDALCADLLAHHYDLKHLMRVILTSRTYALASDPLPTNAADRTFFSHYLPRRLPAEVLADAITQATGVAEPYEGYALGLRAMQLPDPKVRSYFLDTFGRPERVTACACERSSEVTMPQALHLVNGEDLDRRLAAPEGRLQRLLKSGKPDREVVEELFLATLSRGPTAEQARAVERTLAAASDRAAAYRDLLWALLNSKEFLFGH